MKTEKIYNMINSGNINIPFFIYKNKSVFKINDSELIFLMYLDSFCEESSFNPMLYVEQLNITMDKVLEFTNKLSSIGLIEIKTNKNSNGVMEEIISLKPFHHKLLAFLIDEDNDSENNSDESNAIYSKIEKEFGRVLTPIEYEIINAWFESNYKVELIEAAIKEAVFNGVTSLRYIDKILYEWSKKGFKGKADVEKSKEKWKNKGKESEIINKPKKEVFDYNWLEDEDDG